MMSLEGKNAPASPVSLDRTNAPSVTKSKKFTLHLWCHSKKKCPGVDVVTGRKNAPALVVSLEGKCHQWVSIFTGKAWGEEDILPPHHL